MKISENITRETFSERGGGCELDLTAFGYEDELMSAYQNYLGGGIRGSVANSCTIEDWEMDENFAFTFRPILHDNNTSFDGFTKTNFVSHDNTLGIWRVQRKQRSIYLVRCRHNLGVKHQTRQLGDVIICIHTL